MSLTLFSISQSNHEPAQIQREDMYTLSLNVKIIKNFVVIFNSTQFLYAARKTEIIIRKTSKYSDCV